MGTKVKICGLRRRADILYVNEAYPDFAGFIFDSKRRRWIDPESASVLRAELAEGIRAVGVFVDASPDFISETAETVKLDLIQLHGTESADFIRNIKRMTGLPVIKAFRIEGSADAEAAAGSPADIVLLDNGKGGTGESFDWSFLRDFPRDYMLAGGIGADNAAEAIEKLNPWGLDASSSLETNGFKDHDKIISFMDAVRSTDRSNRRRI